jgi:hypothetical protein
MIVHPSADMALYEYLLRTAARWESLHIHRYIVVRQSGVDRPADDRLRATIGLGAFFSRQRLEAAVYHHIQPSHRSCSSEEEELLVFNNPLSVYSACQTPFLRQRRSSCHDLEDATIRPRHGSFAYSHTATRSTPTDGF